MWVALGGNTGFVSLETGVQLVPNGSGSTWNLRVVAPALTTDISGTYGSQADAHDAARRLVHGVDVADVI